MKTERTVNLYCSRDLILLQHLANHLTNSEIDNYIFGDVATNVLGIDNPTQVACIRVFQTDYVKAKALIDKYLE